MTTSSKDAREASCAASCRSCSERDTRGGRTKTHEDGCEQTHARTEGPTQTRSRSSSRRDEGPKIPWAETNGQGGPRAASKRICRALRFQISGVMLECSFWCTTSAETVAFARDGFAESAKRSTCPGGHSKFLGFWRCVDGGGMGGVGHNNQVWPQASIACGLGWLAGCAENRSKCSGR